MNKLFIIISLLFFYVGFSQNNSFYGAFESSGVYYSQNESKDFEKKVKEEFGSSLGDLHLISKINEWPILRIDVPKPTGIRTVLLGDAAHSIYPLAGQGFNLAIGDILQITDTMLWAK